MARFERGEGASGEFWEVRTDGAILKSVLTERWGLIGTEGQQREQTHSSGMEARAVLQRLVREKVAQGFKHVKPTDPGPGPLSHPELEEAILRAPESPEGYLVYGDWLQARGDPRGELIAVQHALLHAWGEEAQALKRKGDDLLAAHRKLLLGNALVAAIEDRMLTVQWHLGFLRSARLEVHDYDEVPDFSVEEALALLLAHPSARFLQELTLGLVGRQALDVNHYGDPLAVIGRSAHRALRTLFLGDFDYPSENQISWTYVGDVSPLYPGVPQLRSLRLVGRDVQLGDIDLPELRDFKLESGGLGRAAVESIARARWPKLERLEVWFGSSEYDAEGGVEDLMPLLEARGVPALRHLGLCNAEFTDALCEVLPKSPVLKQLHTLDLSRGTLTDAGAAVLAANAAAFTHLQRLDVTRNLLSEEGARLLAKLCPDVALGLQRVDDAEEGEPRYVAVGE